MSVEQMQTDEEIIRQCLGGDCEVYALLVERYQNDIASQVRWYAKTVNEIEEMAQEVFVQAYMSLPTFSGKAPFVHWLKKIASRVGYAHLKEVYRQRKNFSVEDWDAPVTEVDQVDAEEACSLMRPMLERLSVEDRMVLTLLYIENLTTREIAERMGWNRAMVKMRVYRAKKKVRESTKKVYGPEKYQELLEAFA